MKRLHWFVIVFLSLFGVTGWALYLLERGKQRESVAVSLDDLHGEGKPLTREEIEAAVRRGEKMIKENPDCFPSAQTTITTLKAK